MATITKQSEHEIHLTFSAEESGLRLDKALAGILEGRSRANIQQWIKDGDVTVDGKTCKPKEAVLEDQTVHINVPETQALDIIAQEMDLNIVYEDETILVVNKPAGLVVHPGAGNPSGTLLNGLLAFHQPLKLIARGGIVHRLDKDTSGLMVVAKTEAARQNLVEQLSNRTVKREYQALVYGTLVAGGTVNEPIGRHPKDRLKMTVRSDGRPAITHYRIGQKYRTSTLLNVFLETGRTHQIRVHLSNKGLPLIGDPIYGKRLHLPRHANETLVKTMSEFKRQALHARQLGLQHPESGELITWTAEMPDDMADLCALLEADARDVKT